MRRILLVLSFMGCSSKNSNNENQALRTIDTIKEMAQQNYQNLNRRLFKFYEISEEEFSLEDVNFFALSTSTLSVEVAQNTLNEINKWALVDNAYLSGDLSTNITMYHKHRRYIIGMHEMLFGVMDTNNIIPAIKMLSDSLKTGFDCLKIAITKDETLICYKELQSRKEAIEDKTQN